MFLETAKSFPIWHIDDDWDWIILLWAFGGVFSRRSGKIRTIHLFDSQQTSIDRHWHSKKRLASFSQFIGFILRKRKRLSNSRKQQRNKKERGPFIHSQHYTVVFLIEVTRTPSVLHVLNDSGGKTERGQEYPASTTHSHTRDFWEDFIATWKSLVLIFHYLSIGWIDCTIVIWIHPIKVHWLILEREKEIQGRRNTKDEFRSSSGRRFKEHNVSFECFEYWCVNPNPSVCFIGCRYVSCCCYVHWYGRLTY